MIFDEKPTFIHIFERDKLCHDTLIHGTESIQNGVNYTSFVHQFPTNIDIKIVNDKRIQKLRGSYRSIEAHQLVGEEADDSGNKSERK